MTRELIEIHESLDEQKRELLRIFLGLVSASIGLLGGERGEMEETVRRFVDERDRPEGDDRAILQIALRNSEAIESWLAEEGAGDPIAGALAVLRLPVLTPKDLIRRVAAVERLEEKIDAGETVSTEILRDALLEALEWLDSRELFAWMKPLVDRLQRWIPPALVAAWRERIATIERDRIGAPASTAADRRPRLSMLGRIELVRPEGEPARPRGARLRTLLGVMVANEMLDRPLSNREFYTLAAGEEDLDRARNTVYAAMHRLRESIGPDIVIGDGETPRLNLDLVEVDLLEARAFIDEARAAAHEGALMRAAQAMTAALDLVGGEVAFPTLYDPFFTAARQDFEQEVAETALLVARFLLREGDRPGATALTARAAELFPDHPELLRFDEKVKRDGEQGSGSAISSPVSTSLRP